MRNAIIGFIAGFLSVIIGGYVFCALSEHFDIPQEEVTE